MTFPAAPTESVRIHLKQAILIGDGDEARYAKVLVGKRDPSSDLVSHRVVVFHAFMISGFVRGYRDATLSIPTLHRLADSNILSVEDVTVDTCCDVGPPHAPNWLHARRRIKLCSQENVHPPHTWQYTGSLVINCPGVEVAKDENRTQRPATSRDRMEICPLRRKSSRIHAGHHYHDREGMPVQCPGWGGKQ